MRNQRRRASLGWTALLLGSAALVAIGVPAVAFGIAASSEGVSLDGTEQRILLPEDRTYGVYVDDVDNSGYAYSCGAHDNVREQRVTMDDPWFTITSSDTEMLDSVFDTGSGDLLIKCAAANERVTARPVPNLRAVLLGLVVGGTLGCGALAIGVTWLTRRPDQTTRPRSTTYDGSASTDRSSTGSRG